MTTTLQAPAKINLSIDVVGKKDNGYHLLEMIMQTVTLYDTVTVKPSNKTELKCNKAEVPTNQDNICLKAWQIMKKSYDLPDGIEISIEKNIPVAAGMAGGSTNGAATIIAINEEYGLGLSQMEMMQIASSLGSDVPFCIQKGTALATGIGDKISPLPKCPKLYVLAVNAGFPVSTVQVYKNLVWHKVNKHPNTQAIIKAIKKNMPNQIFENTENVLENSAFQLFPQLAVTKKQIADTGIFAMMSGSGGTMLGISDDKEKVMYSLKQVKNDYIFAKVFETE